MRIYPGMNGFICMKSESTAYVFRSNTRNEESAYLPLQEKGILIKIDGVLCLKRSCNDEAIPVFVFRDSTDREDLCPEHTLKVNDTIFNCFSACMSILLKREFEKCRQMGETENIPEAEGETVGLESGS